MRLYLCDIALERARLALARRRSLRAAERPRRAEPAAARSCPTRRSRAALRGGAQKQLDVARKLIAECGYHRRDEELAELDGVVARRPPLRRSAAARLSWIDPGSVAPPSPRSGEATVLGGSSPVFRPGSRLAVE